jgi:hypothetical protein
MSAATASATKLFFKTIMVISYRVSKLLLGRKTTKSTRTYLSPLKLVGLQKYTLSYDSEIHLFQFHPRPLTAPYNGGLALFD